MYLRPQLVNILLGANFQTKLGISDRQVTGTGTGGLRKIRHQTQFQLLHISKKKYI